MCICDSSDDVGKWCPWERSSESVLYDDSSGEWMYLVNSEGEWHVVVTFEGGSPAGYGPIFNCPMCGKELQ